MSRVTRTALWLAMGSVLLSYPHESRHPSRIGAGILAVATRIFRPANLNIRPGN